MAEAEPRCSACGRILDGRDVYEKKCTACREREVLYGGSVAAAREKKEEAKPTGPKNVCPDCGKTLPPRGRFCLECGCDLYAKGLRKPSRLPCVVVLLLVICGGAVGWHVISKPPVKGPTSVQVEIRELTEELMMNLSAGDYATVVKQYYSEKADPVRYEKFQQALIALTKKEGILYAGSLEIKDLEKQAEAVEPDRKEYLAGLIHQLTNGRLRQAVGRTDRYFEWYLKEIFGKIDLSKRKILKIKEPAGQDPEFSDNLEAVVELDYLGQFEPTYGLDDPRTLVWKKKKGGKWQLKYIEKGYFDEAMDLLKRLGAR